jgi:hypothetical protein
MSDLVHKTADELANFGGQLVARLPKALIVSLVALVMAALAVIVGTFLVAVIAIALGRTVELGWLGRFGVSSTTEGGGLVNSPTALFQLEQRKFLVEMMLRSDPGFDNDMATIYKCFSEWPSSGFESSTISVDDANKIITSKDQTLFTAIKHHLNHLEADSVAYLQGVVDSAAFETSYKHSIQMWYRRYKAALRTFESHCGCQWLPFEKLGSKWEDPAQAPSAANRYGDSCQALFGKG